MPLRRIKFLNKGIYHIFNQTIEKKRIFENADLCNIFLETLRFYRSKKPTISFSKYRSLDPKDRKKIDHQISMKKFFKFKILSYCLMPTHFHLLLQQITEESIIKPVGDIMNSFTRYFNVKFERRGPIFLPRVHAQNMTSDEQLMHSSRYLHLNPYSSGLIKDKRELENYPFSSFGEYLNKTENPLCEPGDVLYHFNYDPKKYKEFVLNHADWQRTLELVKYTKRWKI